MKETPNEAVFCNLNRFVFLKKKIPIKLYFAADAGHCSKATACHKTGARKRSPIQVFSYISYTVHRVILILLCEGI